MKTDSMLKKLAASLERFYPEMRGMFGCPTCLEGIPLSQRHRVSLAHVIPRASGGTLTTLICTRCNSEFGRLQDKWFGEHLHLRKLNKSLLATRHQQGSFVIGGERVNGRYLTNAEGGFDFLIYTDKNNPKTLRRLDERFARRDGDIRSIKVPLPYLRNRWLVPFGFLTAAYLMWFRQLGYSFAYQRHLDQVRQWIRSPRDGALPPTCIVTFEGKVFDSPWIGIGKVGDCLALLAGICDRVVLLPTAHTPDLHSRLPNPLSGVLGEEDYEVLTMREAHEFGEPIAVAYRNWMMIWPDVASRGGLAATLYFPGGHEDAQLLRPIDPSEAKSLRQDGAVDVKVDPFKAFGDGMTGRHGDGSKDDGGPQDCSG